MNYEKLANLWPNTLTTASYCLGRGRLEIIRERRIENLRSWKYSRFIAFYQILLRFCHAKYLAKHVTLAKETTFSLYTEF